MQQELRLKAQIVSGLRWQLLARGSDRVLRFASNVVLAKLLAPSDFGLMAIVVTGLGAVDAIAFMATDQAIVHSDRGRDRDYLETTFWTASVRGLLVGLVLLALAPAFAGFFRRPDALAMFAAIALYPVFMGLANPRAQVLVKDMRFARWSSFRLGCSVLGVSVCVTVALWLRSAWALLIGQLAQQLFLTVFSYAIAPFRPRARFSRECWAELRRFGLQAAGVTVFLSLIAQAPAVLLGRAGVVGALGVYMLSDRLASIPLEIALQVVGSVAMPAYSMLKNDRERLAALWLKALRAIGLLGLPVAAVLAWMGSALPHSVYGAEYAGCRGVFSMLAAGGALAMLLAVTGPLFWGVGRPAYDRAVQALRAAVVYGVGMLLIPLAGPLGMAVAVAVAFVLALTLALCLVRRVIDVTCRQFVGALLPGATMAAAVLAPLGVADALLDLTGWGRVGLGCVVGLAAGGLVLALLKKQYGEPKPGRAECGMRNADCRAEDGCGLEEKAAEMRSPARKEPSLEGS